MKKTAIISIFAILIFAVTAYCFAGQTQEKKSLKEQALEAFRKEQYPEAIALLEKAVKETPDDAEIWYYLGWFSHYLGSDTRPMTGHNYLALSQKIFEYLNEAIRLNPQYGDALYFYTAECGTMAELALLENDLEKLKYWYKRAYDKGGFPAWMLEWGRNLLNTCEKDAILFTGGDVDLNVCRYLQLHENHRTDITIIPIVLIERPLYVKLHRDGLDGGVRKVNIELDDWDIMSIRPYKWEPTPILIPVSQALKNEFNLDKNFQFKWIVEPDFVEPGRVVTKGIEGEEARARTYLSPRRAMLLEIVEKNFNERPIHFSSGVHPNFFAGLQPYFENRGLTYRLVPVETTNTKFATNFSKLETMLTPENLKDFQSIKSLNMPRVSGILFNYHTAIQRLAQHYKQTNQSEKLNRLIDTYKTYLAIGFDKEYEETVLRAMLR
jgi:tetratricopeptide (TPR) repeat protein